MFFRETLHKLKMTVNKLTRETEFYFFNCWCKRRYLFQSWTFYTHMPKNTPTSGGTVPLNMLTVRENVLFKFLCKRNYCWINNNKMIHFKGTVAWLFWTLVFSWIAMQPCFTPFNLYDFCLDFTMWIFANFDSLSAYHTQESDLPILYFSAFS